MELKYIVRDETNLIKIIKDKLHISSRLYRKIKNDYVLINGKKANNTLLKNGDVVIIQLDYDEDNSNIVSNKEIKLTILYEDDWFLIVDKQAGLPIHPSLHYYENSLSNGVKYYYEQNNIHKKIRPINRLAKYDLTSIVRLIAGSIELGSLPKDKFISDISFFSFAFIPINTAIKTMIIINPIIFFFIFYLLKILILSCPNNHFIGFFTTANTFIRYCFLFKWNTS